MHKEAGLLLCSIQRSPAQQVSVCGRVARQLLLLPEWAVNLCLSTVQSAAGSWFTERLRGRRVLVHVCAHSHICILKDEGCWLEFIEMVRMPGQAFGASAPRAPVVL